MLKNKIVLLVGIAFLIVALAFLYAAQQKQGSGLPPDFAKVTIYPEKGKMLEIKAEVADSNEERERGLMFRKSLGEKEGMLFVYPEAAVVSFWMKNTLIPLDMIFIAENMTIAKVHHAVPCREEPCPLYSSEKPVKYVLEVNGKFTANSGVLEGSRVEIKD